MLCSFHKQEYMMNIKEKVFPIILKFGMPIIIISGHLWISTILKTMIFR